MRQYSLSGLAQQDLQEIGERIAQDTLTAALRTLDTLEGKFQRLADMPGIGHFRPELAAELRSFGVPPYLIFYRESDGGIVVLRVLHGAREIDESFFPA
jgi:toxin ParE1/3/4